ncbi:MAG: DNA-directed RNA polymerase subunit omega [Candidatus Omnitrophota bacterium]
MAYIDLERLLEKSGGSIYKLVVVASRRALEIAEGQAKLVEVSSAVKPSSVALMEIAAGKVRYKKAAAAK